MKNKKRNIFRFFVRWGLGLHGAFHVIKTGFNIYEQAWISAFLSAFIAFLMLAGACLDLSPHKGDGDGRKD
jgi:hypothetical protein